MRVGGEWPRLARMPEMERVCKHRGKDFRVRVLVMSPRAKAGVVRPDCKAISGDGRSIRWRRFTVWEF